MIIDERETNQEPQFANLYSINNSYNKEYLKTVRTALKVLMETVLLTLCIHNIN